MKDKKLPPHPEEPWDIDPAAPDCDDQLAVISKVGRGLKGDSFRIDIARDTPSETYLEGLKYNENTHEWESIWYSENVNGGQLMYQYNLRSYTSPQTFTITFRYKRPNRSESEWIWTTPAIPYIWDADNDGLADVDNIVGSGVSTLLIKKTTEAKWNYPTVTASDYANGLMTYQKHDKLLYPDGWTRAMFNAPDPGNPWSVNLQYGVGGDIDGPNSDDIAKILGIAVGNVRNIIAGTGGDQIKDPSHNISTNDFKDYIDSIDDHIHDDMGFGDVLTDDRNSVSRNTIKKYIDGLRSDIYKNAGLSDPSSNFFADTGDLSLRYVQKYGPNAGTTTTHATLKSYVDARLDDLQEGLDAQTATLKTIVNKIAGGGTVNLDGSITWPSNSPLSDPNVKIAAGNINLYSGSNETVLGAKGIFTHVGASTDDDLKAV